MWASYAAEKDKHTGACLKLRGVELDHRIENKFKDGYKVFRDSVEYNDDKFFNHLQWLLDVSQTINVLSQTVREHLFDHYQYYFLLKSEDWCTENEFRWLIHSEENHPEYISIEGILDEVILGQDFPKDDETTVKKLCSDLGISVGKLKWPNGIPQHRIISSL